LNSPSPFLLTALDDAKSRRTKIVGNGKRFEIIGQPGCKRLCAEARSYKDATASRSRPRADGRARVTDPGADGSKRDNISVAADLGAIVYAASKRAGLGGFF
jgi:hypothetical protein